MRIIFMGTPEFAVPTLTEIVSTGHEVVAVYTRAPKPAGRGQAERKSPVHEAAEGFGIPVFTPRSLKGAPEQEVFASLDADRGAPAGEAGRDHDVRTVLGHEGAQPLRRAAERDRQDRGHQPLRTAPPFGHELDRRA